MDCTRNNKNNFLTKKLLLRINIKSTVRTVHTIYLEILVVIKFGDLPEIRQKCIVGGI